MSKAAHQVWRGATDVFVEMSLFFFWIAHALTLVQVVIASSQSGLAKAMLHA
jgi:hypothetical protein